MSLCYLNVTTGGENKTDNKATFILHPTASCGEPPKVPNAKVFGKKRQRYETNTKVRYYCEEGFVQKLDPVIRCLPSGQWEQPLITCKLSECMNWLII